MYIYILVYLVFKQRAYCGNSKGKNRGMLLESITGGLYDGNLNSIREYIQNSIDAHSEKIEIFFENGYENLIIRDDGNGMNIGDIYGAFGIGVSSKNGIESNIGWRGIGIWSGIPIAERIVFITKRREVPGKSSTS